MKKKTSVFFARHLGRSDNYYAFAPTKKEALEVIRLKIERSHGALSSGMMARVQVVRIGRSNPIYQFHEECPQTGRIAPGGGGL